MSRPMLRDRRYTYADYLTWTDDERRELIQGQPYAMSPAPGPQHQTVCWELAVQIGQFLRGRPCRAFSAPFDVRLAQDDAADDSVDTVVQPDLCVVCDLSRLDDRGCRGAPDWVIEVLPPRTAARDQIQKLALYERHGVREYWLVHPTDRVVTVYRLGDDGRYGRPGIAETRGCLGVRVLDGLAIDWDWVFEKL